MFADDYDPNDIPPDQALSCWDKIMVLQGDLIISDFLSEIRQHYSDTS